MILKASQRGGPRQLAAHLLNDRDNDHVVLQELRGFVSTDLYGAMAETTAIAKGTRCRQPIFSLSLNPPKDEKVSIESFIDAADRAELTLGLGDQPRAIVIHEKNGRRHAHVVWSRIDPEEMKAVNLPHFKNKLTALSKELYLENDWSLPDGHRENGWKNPLNFTLAEWQQAKRLDLDPREIKQVFRDAWARSDNLASYKNALEEHGFYLAKGDRRAIVATDLNGEVFAAARWTGVKSRDFAQKLGKGELLPALSDAQADLRRRSTKQLRQFIAEDRTVKTAELKPLKESLAEVVTDQRKERADLLHKQDERWQSESSERASRFRRGLGIVLDVLTGRLFKQRKQNETEAYAAFVRDRAQRHRLYDDQARDRAPIQERIAQMQQRHRQERRLLAQRVAAALRATRNLEHTRERKSKDRDQEFNL